MMPQCHSCGRFCRPVAWKMIYSGALPEPQEELYRCADVETQKAPAPSTKPDAGNGWDRLLFGWRSQRAHTVIVAHDQREVGDQRADDLRRRARHRQQRGLGRQRRRRAWNLHRNGHLDLLNDDARGRGTAGEQQRE